MRALHAPLSVILETMSKQQVLRFRNCLRFTPQNMRVLLVNATMSGHLPARPILLLAATLMAAAPSWCWSQAITFSVDVQGPTAGSFGSSGLVTDSFYNNEIDGGDILTVGVPGQPLPPGPNLAARGPVEAPPGIVVFGIDQGVPNSRTLGLNGVLIGTRPELEIEIDALSFGHDHGLSLFFSVDEFSLGTLGDVADQALGFQAAADIFREVRGPEGHVLAIDGTGGERPNRMLGLGLVEPNPPNTLPSNPGDNLDALDVNTDIRDLEGPIFFSLDAAFPDPAEQLEPGTGPNIGSAQQNDVSGADILVSLPDQRQPQVYLSAQQLGLDPLADDVDALAIMDAAQDGVFDFTNDQVLFSVRRGSQIVGQLDAEFQLPIAPGDILTVPFAPRQPPAIVVPAEALGLNANRNLDLIAPVVDPLPDDLDALSLGIQDGDMNCNFFWDAGDVAAFALALESTAKYEQDFIATCFGPAELHGDVNMDGRFGFQDIEDFVRILGNSGAISPAQVEAILARHVPEAICPSACLAIVLMVVTRKMRSIRAS